MAKRPASIWQKWTRQLRGRVLAITAPYRTPPLDFTSKELRLLKGCYRDANTTLEYGAGGSTILAAELGTSIRSIETDQLWAKGVSRRLKRLHLDSHAKVIHANIGPTRSLGYPEDETRPDLFKAYCELGWQKDDSDHPDLVLIDGRFRVACFLTALKNISKPTRILWDDYKRRKQYHVVETIVWPSTLVGKIAVFDIKPLQFTHEMQTLLEKHYAIPN